MNRKDTIRMAREAGFSEAWLSADENPPHFEAPAVIVGRFAALVAAAERTAMMQLFTDPENQPTQHGTVTVEYMQREIAAEREACAKVCEELRDDWLRGLGRYEFMGEGADYCADAIRARGQQ